MKHCLGLLAAASMLAACTASEPADSAPDGTSSGESPTNVEGSVDTAPVDTRRVDDVPTPSTVAPGATASTVVDDLDSEPDVAVETDDANWALRSPTIDPAATSIPILVLEDSCNSASSATGRIVADVVESDTVVSIAIGVVPLDGAQECQGGPATAFTLQLASPIGEREIVGDADPDAVSNELPVVRVGTVDPALPPVDVVSSSNTEGPFWNDFSCETTGADQFYVEAALPEPTDVLVLAAATRGYRTDGWHEFRQASRNQFGSDEITYAQFIDGVAVTAVSVTGSITEWVGSAAGCNDLPADWTPDLEPPDDAGRIDRGVEEFRFAEPLDLAALADATPGLSVVSADTWAFDDPDASRCLTWIALEDAAADAGFVVGESLVVADFPPPDVTVVPAQQTMPIGARSGQATRLRTHVDGTITILPATAGGFFDALADTPSSLTPCRLDEVLAVERVG